jgi:hypothetical protein
MYGASQSNARCSATCKIAVIVVRPMQCWRSARKQD